MARARDLYREPPNRFTAEFLGRANLLPVKLEALEEGGRLGRVRFGAATLRARVPADLAARGDLPALRAAP